MKYKWTLIFKSVTVNSSIQCNSELFTVHFRPDLPGNSEPIFGEDFIGYDGTRRLRANPQSTNQNPAKPYLHASAVRYSSKDQKKIKSITNKLTGYLYCIDGTNKDPQTEDTLLL
jgi:hypothetical protein